MLSVRTLASLSQFLALQPESSSSVLFEKCGFGTQWTGLRGVNGIFDRLRSSSLEQIRGVLVEISHSTRMLRNEVSPKYLYDERWTDLVRCLLLDGYRISGDYAAGYAITTLDPTIEAVRSFDDDLTAELVRSNLRDSAEVIRLMKNSAEDFCKQPQDFNGSLTSARVSLETLAKNISEVFWTSKPMVGDAAKFGANISYLRNQVGFLSLKEESGITGVYAFVIPGAHVPIGLSEEEMVRLGRTMIAAMCYFLIKRYNQ